MSCGKATITLVTQLLQLSKVFERRGLRNSEDGHVEATDLKLEWFAYD